MMFLSRVRRQDVRIISHAAEDPLMTDLYEEHKFIWELFPRNTEIKRDFLYRRVDERLGPLFYVLSRRKPTNQPEGWVIDTKKFEPIIKAGDMFQFSLRVNPVVTRKPEGNLSKKRKRDDIYMDALAKYKDSPDIPRPSNTQILSESVYEWLDKRSEACGFSLLKASVLVEGYQRAELQKSTKKDSIQFGVVDLSGRLTVTNAELFYKTLNQGIGKARAFGCGLLLIKRI
jgi:CRISPR system Cascade subunit CasE